MKKDDFGTRSSTLTETTTGCKYIACMREHLLARKLKQVVELAGAAQQRFEPGRQAGHLGPG